MRKANREFYLWLSRVAVATSGDMMQFVIIDGKRYSHIVDPKTGIGLTDHNQVTVIAPDGITADGLSTAVSVMGPEKGLKLIETTPMPPPTSCGLDGKIETQVRSDGKSLKGGVKLNNIHFSSFDSGIAWEE